MSINIFHKVTLEILKKNKTRTIVTIIGIILSASMFTAVTTTVSSVRNYLLENAYYNHGNWHLSALEVDETFFEFLKNPDAVVKDAEEQAYFEEGSVETYVYSQQLGYAYAEGSTNEYKPYLYLIGADKDFYENMPVHLTGGRLPEKADEILLPEHLAENGEVYYKLGDVLTLEIGNRMTNGYVLGQYNPYMNAEESEPVEGSDVSPENDTDKEVLEVMETRTFTVVGFYERPSFENYSAPGYTAITVMDKVRPEGSLYNFYLSMEDPQDAFVWFSNMNRFWMCGSTMNDNVLTYLGVLGYESFYVVLYGLAAIVCGLIMFGSVSLIYNAFSISVSERTKQFGLLSSIGATKKQIRKMVLFEALFVSAIGIPLGILAGVGGMGVTFYFLGKAFNELTNYIIPFTLYVYPISIVAACVITLSTVLISAWIPSKRATMVTALEAIRQSGDVKLTKREQKYLHKVETENVISVNEQKLAYRFFGLPGMIADKYYKRSKRKYRTTVVSLFMSIVLFVSASAFTTYLTDSVDNSLAGNGYDLMYAYDPTVYMTLEEIEQKDFEGLPTQEAVSELFAEAESVTYTTYAHRQIVHARIEKEHLTDSYIQYLTEKNECMEVENSVENGFENNIALVFVEDQEYEVFLEKYKLDKNLYLQMSEPLGIAIEGNTFFDYDLQQYVTTNILNSTDADIMIEKEVAEGEYENISLKIGTILKERPYFVSNSASLTIVYPYSLKDEESLIVGYNRNYLCDHYILSDDHKASYEDLKQILVEQGLSKNYLYNYAEGVEENRTLILIINVFSYGFIALISLIAAANVFNTISTNISLRRREFAMLKSVGMSNKEMNRMMNFECLLYGSRALLYGLPVSVIITWMIYRIISEGFSTGFYLPWGAILIAIGSVFLVVFSTMMYSMRKIKADNPLDALRNENL